MIKFFKGLAIWGILYTLVYLGMFTNSQGLQNIIMFVIWATTLLLLLSTIVTIFDNVKREPYGKTSFVHKWVSRIVTMTLLLIVIYQGHYFLAICWIVLQGLVFIDKDLRIMDMKNKYSLNSTS